MFYRIKRFIKRLIVLIKTTGRTHKKQRGVDRQIRQAAAKAIKRTMFQDLVDGVALEDFNMLPVDKDILYQNPSYKELRRLSKEYRGIKIGNHPTIYRTSTNKSRY